MAKKNDSQAQEKNVQLITSLPVTLRDQVKQLAKRDETSLSSVVRRAVRQFFETQTA